MNYTTQCRDLAMAVRHRVLVQFGVSLEQGQAEHAIKSFVDRVFEIAKATQAGEPTQTVFSFDIAELFGIPAVSESAGEPVEVEPKKGKGKGKG